jgi:leucyl aminopeptidase
VSEEFSPAKGRRGIVAETRGVPQSTEAEAVVVFMAEGASGSGDAAAIDAATGGLLSKVAATGELTGKRNECVALHSPPGMRSPQLVVVGIGKREAVDSGTLFQAAATAARHLAGRKRGTVAFVADGSWGPRELEHAVAGAAVGMTGQDLYRRERKRTPFGRTVWLGAADDAVDRGSSLADGINLARRLVNGAPDDVYPESFAEEAARVASRVGLEVDIWDEKRLAAERCGAMLAVAKGSDRPARLVLLRHRGRGGNGPPDLALVGKGVTFDSGGLSLKPSESMFTMKCDMAGGASVLGAITTIAALRLPIDVVAAIGLVENMTGPAAYKLGDVLTARSGTTIEIHNTDAEGRLVLADVLDVVKDFKPAKILDLATLTGACVVALGTDVAGLFTNDQPWCDRIAAAAKLAGEPVWQLPMFPEYDRQIESEVADIKNVGDGRWGGAITAAKFLERFVAGIPWTHVDIAGPAFAEKPKPWTDGGGTGVMVKTIVELARGLLSASPSGM